MTLWLTKPSQAHRLISRSLPGWIKIRRQASANLPLDPSAKGLKKVKMVKFCNFHTVQYVPERCVVSGWGGQFTKSDQGSDLNLIILGLVKLFQNVGSIPDNHICILFLSGSCKKKKKLREISNRNIFRVNVFARSFGLRYCVSFVIFPWN